MENLPNPSSLAFVEDLYIDYLRDPNSVDAQWRDYFRTLPDGNAGVLSGGLGPRFKPSGVFNPAAQNGNGLAARPPADQVANLQDRLDQLVRAYRVRGHTIAQLDPLGSLRREHTELDPKFYGFTEVHMDQPFSSRTIYGSDVRTLRQIIERLRATYCRRIGVQFMHIDDPAVRNWLQQQMESTENRIHLTREDQIRILTRLTDAEIFEEFIQKKYIGAKSFSLQGSESLIPLLDLAIEKAGNQGIVEIVLAMAHRGRLNVLANILGKSPTQIFREFEDRDPDLNRGRGDVKYHLGHSTDWQTASGRKVHLSLCFNPSHLEYVNTVALGRVRAKQDLCGDKFRVRGMALLIHGDAAFAGEGIIQETLNLSELEGYTTGGTLHVIVNNQIGFTTSPEEGRSTVYASDVAKMLQIPIFHVNGEDPEAVAQVVRLSMDFREAFKRDAVVDMYGYRRQGHNETDEPSFTHPVTYRAIQSRKTVREAYLDRLLKWGGITREEADHIAQQRRELLERELSAARSQDYKPPTATVNNVWSKFFVGRDKASAEVKTGVSTGQLAQLLEKQTQFPPDFHPHPKIERAIQIRRQMAAGARALDWSTAESLAFATLAVEGRRIRLSGQDSARGTFSQRHAVLHDVNDGHTYTPLEHLSPDQAPVEIINSPLSEAGVLGFDYGYSLDYPEALIMWEAQFGDFINAAQVIVDQFIASAEAKWHRLSGIVLLLPHGFEGQGPEHSSARLERFLALAADSNLQVANLTTPAQYFHLLRRQVLRRWRKPLIVMTPKSLLRHARAVSSLDDLASGRFHCIIPDSRFQEAKPASAGVVRVLLCSGKIYYELEERREKLQRADVAIVRLEQLYPIDDAELAAALAPFKPGTQAFWVQEEPENMGAWRYLYARFGQSLLGRFPFSAISRPAAASPATGSHSSHKVEQEEILAAAVG